MTLTGGFTFISDSASLAPGSLVTGITGITNSTTPVVSITTTPSIGQVVRLYNTTGALQLAGMDYQVANISAGSTMTLTTGTAAGSAATGGSYRIINAKSRYYPQFRYIGAMTAANPCVITTTVDHGFTAGQLVRLVVPTGWGMTQANEQQVTITAVTHNTLTVNLDTSSFTAFAYPTSAVAAAGVSFPMVAPIGEASTSPYQNTLDDATSNTSFTGVQIGSTVLQASCNYFWIARFGQAM
jgi:hypothetical protein